MQLLVVTGLSGAGKSTALSALADVGFYCVDNLPVPLLPDLMRLVADTRGERVAVVIDARDRQTFAGFPAMRETLEGEGYKLEVLYLEAPKEVVMRRYSETRRLHPLGELPGAIDREIEVLKPVRATATTVVDTANLRGRQLRGLVRERYGASGVLNVMLMSFGFKNGMPVEADLVFDARFLANPFDVPELRPLSGFDTPVSGFVLEQPDAAELLDRIDEHVRFQVPRTAQEGRSYLTVAIGCTGGQHRSVALVEALKRRLRDSEQPLYGAGDEPFDASARLAVRHRDVQTGGNYSA